MPNYKVRVGNHADSDKSFGLLVDVRIDPETRAYSASRLEWFPKSICLLEKIEIEGKLPEYYLTAPKWLLKQKKVNYEKI